MNDPRDYKLEITGVTPTQNRPACVGRPYLSVRFDCCGAYTRVYRNPDDPEYVARCPRCLKTVRFPVSPGGTSSRFFAVR